MSPAELLLVAILALGGGWACLAIGDGPRMRLQGITGALLVSLGFWLVLAAAAAKGLSA
jgi:hypothetical protein